MDYTHHTMKELSWVETYYDTGLKPYKIAQKIDRSNQPVYNVVTFLKEGGTVIEDYDQYKQNKEKCGAKKKTFTRKQIQYIKDKIKFQRAGSQMSSLVELKEISVVRCEPSTDYRRFKESSLFDVITLPMKGKRKPNGHKETRENKAIKETLKTARKLTQHSKMSLDIWKVIPS